MLGAMPTLVVGMFVSTADRMATTSVGMAPNGIYQDQITFVDGSRLPV